MFATRVTGWSLAEISRFHQGMLCTRKVFVYIMWSSEIFYRAVDYNLLLFLNIFWYLGQWYVVFKYHHLAYWFLHCTFCLSVTWNVCWCFNCCYQKFVPGVNCILHRVVWDKHNVFTTIQYPELSCLTRATWNFILWSIHMAPPTVHFWSLPAVGSSPGIIFYLIIIRTLFLSMFCIYAQFLVHMEVAGPSTLSSFLV